LLEGSKAKALGGGDSVQRFLSKKESLSSDAVVQYYFLVSSTLLNLGVSSATAPHEVANYAHLADEEDIDSIWLNGTIDGQYDVSVLATGILYRTRRVRLGIELESGHPPNISTIARTAATLREISPRRLRFSLRFPKLESSKGFLLGESNRRFLRDVATLLRRIWLGERVSYNKNGILLRNYYGRYVLNLQIPIYFSVVGTDLLKLAAEIADGVISRGPKSYLEKVDGIVKEGLAKRCEPKTHFRKIAWLPTLAFGKKPDLKRLKLTAAESIRDMPTKVLEMVDLDAEDRMKIKRIASQERIEKVLPLLNDRIIDEFVIHGTLSQIREQLNSIKKYGLDEVIVAPPYGPDAKEMLVRIGKLWRDLV